MTWDSASEFWPLWHSHRFIVQAQSTIAQNSLPIPDNHPHPRQLKHLSFDHIDTVTKLPFRPNSTTGTETLEFWSQCLWHSHTFIVQAQQNHKDWNTWVLTTVSVTESHIYRSSLTSTTGTETLEFWPHWQSQSYRSSPNSTTGTETLEFWPHWHSRKAQQHHENWNSWDLTTLT